jgi:hypothetical protein
VLGAAFDPISSNWRFFSFNAICMTLSLHNNKIIA